jgi:hypothetical protein
VARVRSVRTRGRYSNVLRVEVWPTMNENDHDMEGRIDALIEELIPIGTYDSAAIASILLACRAALRDGRIADVERIVWWLHDSLKEESFARTGVPANN